jgi:hypothetical protein
MPMTLAARRNCNRCKKSLSRGLSRMITLTRSLNAEGTCIVSNPTGKTIRAGESRPASHFGRDVADRVRLTEIDPLRMAVTVGFGAVEYQQRCVATRHSYSGRFIFRRNAL